MKSIIFAVLALTIVTSGACPERRSFNENFYDFFELIFSESGAEINGLVEAYKQDGDFENSVEFLREQNFHLILTELEGYESFKQVFDSLRKSGVDIETHINTLSAILFTPLSGESSDVTASGSGIYGFLTDFNNKIPYERLKALFREKLLTEELFAQTVKQLYSSEYFSLLNDLFADEAYRNIVNRFYLHGIDLGQVYYTLESVLGNRPFEYNQKRN